VRVRHALLDAALAPRLARTAAALDTLARLLGPYPFASYTTVQVPMTYAGMENAAAPFLRADLYDARAEGRNPVEEVNVHELAHQWWGNAVVPADWRDLWLAEGPATYLTADLFARLDGAEVGRRHLIRITREVGPADAARALVPAAYAVPFDVLSPTVYQKGAAVLHLLRLTVGERAFWQAMRDVQAAHAARPLTTADFRAAFERASGRDLGPFFARWVTGEGLPRLVTRWERRTRTLAWEVTGDGGTLAGVPFEFYVTQRGQPPRWLRATEGTATLRGTARPTVEPVGVLLDVR
jgi:aminopeptidase N